VGRAVGLVAQHQCLQRQPSADAVELPVGPDQRCDDVDGQDEPTCRGKTSNFDIISYRLMLINNETAFALKLLFQCTIRQEACRNIPIVSKVESAGEDPNTILLRQQFLHQGG
jgi:hypothetical protein